MPDLIEEYSSPRFSPKGFPPELRIKYMFEAGQKTKTEHKAKTRAGMLRKSHPVWAETFLAGFYSRPDAPAKPDVATRETSPGQVFQYDLGKSTPLSLEQCVAEMKVLQKQVEAEFEAVLNKTQWYHLTRMKLRITREQIFAYVSFLQRFLGVSKVESEPPALYVQFKCAIWRNWVILAELSNDVINLCGCILRAEPNYQKFLAESEKVFDKWANKDDEGEIILIPDENDPTRENRQYTQENQIYCEAELAQLKVRFAEAIIRNGEQIEQAIAYWSNAIEVDIYGVSYACVAVRLTGHEALLCMVSDSPVNTWPAPILAEA